MTDRLKLYNKALLMCGERALGSLTTNEQSRRLLDQEWVQSDAAKRCLEEGQWKFAMRTIQIDYDPEVSPGFGYQRAFSKPSDWVVTSSVCSDEYFRNPLLDYNDEAGYWYSDNDILYVRYVSNDVAYGMNIGEWPESFAEFVSAHLASRISWSLTGSDEKRKMTEQIRERLKKIALNKDAMADPAKILPPGSWNAARTRGRGRRDRGNITGDLY